MEKVKRRWTLRMPTVYSILFAMIALAAALSWMLPAGKYDYRTAESRQLVPAAEAAAYDGGERLLPVPGSYRELPSSPQGPIDVLTAPIKGFHEAVDVALFVLVMGGFLGVAMRTGAMDAGIGAVVRRFRGREQMLIPILMTLFAFSGSAYGMAEETVAFWALILPVMTAAGYDRMVSAGVILLGSGVGVLCSTVNPFATGIASGFAGVMIGDGIGLRLLMFATLLGLAIAYVMRYAARIKADGSRSVLAGIRFDDEFNRELEAVEFTPLCKLTMTIFFGAFVVMIYGVAPWSGMGMDFLPTLGWWFDELSTLFLGAAVLIAAVNRQTEREFVKNFLNGTRELIGVALVVAVARGIYVVMGNGMIVDTILHWAEELVSGLSSGVFIVAAYYVHIVLSFFIPSTSGLAAVSMPLMGPLADFSNVGRDLVITAYQSASGWINMFAPTSPHLVAGLALANIPYERFFKWVLPFVVLSLLVVTVMLFAAAML